MRKIGCFDSIHAKGIGVKGSEFKFSFLGTRFSESGVKTLKL